MLSPAIVPPTSRIWSTFIGPSLFSRSCWTDTCEAAFSGGEGKVEAPPQGSMNAAVRVFAAAARSTRGRAGGVGKVDVGSGAPAKAVSRRETLGRIAKVEGVMWRRGT